MLTPQEVSTKAFAKAVMGGYNMAMVDEFLDELTDDYTALYKENTALKAKMKVLVEKVEDYRSTEDSMRATLLTAQKMADSIIKEAEEKRAQAFASIEEETRSRVEQARQELAAEQERLHQGKLEMARFVAQCRKVCTEQLALLELLPELSVEEKVAQAVAVDEMVHSIEAQVEQSVEQPVEAWAEEAPAPRRLQPEEVAAQEANQEGNQEATQEMDFDLPDEAQYDTQELRSDLLFGSNYQK